jgi:hypothetical protein
MPEYVGDRPGEDGPDAFPDAPTAADAECIWRAARYAGESSRRLR